MQNNETKFKKLFLVFLLILRRDGVIILIRRLLEKIYALTVVKIRDSIIAYINARNLRTIVYDYKVKLDKNLGTERNVDVVVCVHNALEDVKRCLDSVLKYSGSQYSLIIVDDGSAEDTRDFLADFARNNKVKFIHNEQALGYTFAANIGLRNSSSDYAVLLNSDTIVTHGWLDKMVCCGESDSKIGLVGPLSNTASWQSVPKISENGDWAENILPENIDLEQLAKLISQDSEKMYPKIPLLNGFCLMIKRAVIDDLGYFDEENFGRGYGEENDYCLRAGKNGWSLAVADDTYIFHSQSKSYSSEKRKILSDLAGKTLEKKHGKEIIQEGVECCAKNKVMEGIRVRIGIISKEHYKETKSFLNYDTDLFKPRPRKARIFNNALRAIAVINSGDPSCNKLTMEVLKTAKEKYKNKIEVVIFALDRRAYLGGENKFKFTDLGWLNPQQKSRLFNESDIFVDFSVFQAMGLTAMEAMASGLAVVVPKDGGADSFAKDRINSIVADTSNKDDCLRVLSELIDNDSLRESISRQALKDMPQYHSDFSAGKIADILFG